MFYGEYVHTLDKKGRLIVPSRFRDIIRDNGIEKLYITRGLDECLFIFSEDEWKTQEGKFKTMAFTKREVRKFRRLFFSGAVEVIARVAKWRNGMTTSWDGPDAIRLRFLPSTTDFSEPKRKAGHG